MTRRAERIFRALVRASLDLHARRLWEEHASDDCFAVRVPGMERPMLGSIMGQEGREYGLALYRGESAIGQLARMVESEDPGEDFCEELDQVGFTIQPLREIPVPQRKALEMARFTGRRESPAPLFLVKEPHRLPREIRRREAEALLFAVSGILKADDEARFDPDSQWRRGGEMLTLEITGDVLDPEVRVERRSYGRPPQPEIGSPVVLPDSVARLPRLEGCWLVGLPPTPFSIKGDERTVRLLLIAERDSQLVVTGEAVMGSDMEGPVKRLLAAFRGKNMPGVKGVPREMVFTSRRLYEALAPSLSLLDVQARYEAHSPVLDEIAARLTDAAASDALRGLPGSGAPAPGDLQGWERCDEALVRRATRTIERRRLMNERSVARYFGSAADGPLFLEGESPPGLLPFIEFLITDYRPTGRSRTLAERMLEEKDLAEGGGERALLRARMRARPSIHRVRRGGAPGEMELEDIISGRSTTVHDRRLSSWSSCDVFLPGRIYDAGEFRFLQPLGPPLSPAEVVPAIHWLEDRGIDLHAEDPITGVHLLGRLWVWLTDRHAAGPPQLANTDGDPLEPQVASFSMADPAAARKLLASREDIEHDAGDDVYTWFRKQPGRAMDSVLLGRIQIIGDELLLETNSLKRFERAREWLEALPGMRFQSRQARSLEEIARRPLDDRLDPPKPLEMTEDVVAALRSFFHDYCMRWLDEPIPALDGKSPREACATEEGRREVALMIRAMPSPTDQPGVEVPRREMLRELGLEGDAPG